MTTRVLDFNDSQTSSQVPVIQGASTLALFADNASYEAVYGVGQKGSIYFNTTLNNIVFHDGASWKQNEAELNSFGNTGIPTVNDDESQGFSVGSIFEYNSRFWICKDSTIAGAVWIEFAQDYDGDITNLQNQIDLIQLDQATQNTNISNNTTAIGNNATDISNLQTEQGTQNTNIANNASAISAIQLEQTTQNNNISQNTSDISDLQLEQTTQNNRLTALETVQPTQTIPLQDIDWSLGNVFQKTVSTNEAFTFSNDTDGKTIIVAIFNNSGADVDMTWPVSVKWPSATPVTTVTANTRTVWTFIKVGANIIANAVDGIA